MQRHRNGGNIFEKFIQPATGGRKLPWNGTNLTFLPVQLKWPCSILSAKGEEKKGGEGREKNIWRVERRGDDSVTHWVRLWLARASSSKPRLRLNSRYDRVRLAAKTETNSCAPTISPCANSLSLSLSLSVSLFSIALPRENLRDLGDDLEKQRRRRRRRRRKRRSKLREQQREREREREKDALMEVIWLSGRLGKLAYHDRLSGVGIYSHVRDHSLLYSLVTLDEQLNNANFADRRWCSNDCSPPPCRGTG